MTEGATPSLRRRLGALLYEGLTIFSILLVGFLLPQIVFSGFGFQSSGRLLWLHVFLLLLAYFGWCWTHGGQTLPMKTWKMRIVDAATDAPVRPLQAVLRYCAAWPSILCGGIGILWALADRDRQFLHDRIAGTRITTASPPTQTPPAD